MRGSGLVLGVLLGVLLGAQLWAAGCGPSEPQVPDVAAAPRPFLTVAQSGGVLTLREASMSDEARAVGPALHAIRAPAMHHDGERVCFLGRAGERAPWRLHVATLGSPSLRTLDVPVDEQSAPAWLADDGIVVSAVADDASRALFRVPPSGGPAERITFSGTDARDPCVVRDGRVVYAGTRTTSEGARAPALFAVQPDGTGVLLFHAATSGTRYARPRQAPSGDVTFLVQARGRSRAWVIDWRAPSEPATALEVDADVTLAEPDGADGWLLVARGGATWRVREGQATAGPTWPRLIALADARPRARPQGHSSMVGAVPDPGHLLCVDGRRGVPGKAGAVRLFARRREPEAGAYGWQPLGRVPLAADGSFFAVVPSDTPLRLDVLRADGRVARASRTPFWVRPGETRGCIGCHDAPDSTPPNARPLAVLEAALVPQRAGKEGP